MSKISSEIYENSKLLFLKNAKESFYFKLFILFCVYLFSNYIFDRMNNEDLSKTFQDNKYITINLPNNVTFKLIITLILIITSSWFYNNILKKYIYAYD
jgi:hypothetical protein